MNQRPGQRNQEPTQEPGPPIQSSLQMTDDTWERLLCALERLEQVTEGKNSPRQTATRLDRHKDKGNIQESAREVELEVQLQIKAFKYVVSPVRAEATPWLIKDFASWIGGRKGLALGDVDKYAIPIIQCILGENFFLPFLSDLPLNNPSERDVIETTERLGEGLHDTDKIEEQFSKSPSLTASQHQHIRGSFNDGMSRIQQIAEYQNNMYWFERFCNDKPWNQR